MADKSQPRFRRALANKVNGAKGGRVTTSAYLNGKFGEDFTEKRSRAAGSACLARYGSDYYRHIRSLRKPKPPKLKKLLIKL